MSRRAAREQSEGAHGIAETGFTDADLVPAFVAPLRSDGVDFGKVDGRASDEAKSGERVLGDGAAGVVSGDGRARQAVVNVGAHLRWIVHVHWQY
jgi:hypothetical protein